MKDGNTIVSKILEITANEVKYKKFTNLEGPTYTISKAEVKVINYANGEKESFEDTTTTPTETVSPSASKQEDSISPLQTLSYEQLQSMKTIGSTTSPKIKRLKIIGWTGGGVLVAAGIVLVAIGAPDAAGVDNYDTGLTRMIVGLSLVGVGAAWTAAFLVRANNLKNFKVVTINSTPIYKHEISLKNGKSLMAGVDMLQDSRMPKSKTIGLGLRYNF